MQFRFIVGGLLLCLATVSGASAADKETGWISLFDGKGFHGWKASENRDSWTVEQGAFVCHGPRSHLFYVGNGDRPFKNFEFKCDVKTTPGSNAGIYFHTRYQQEGWPRYGYECQVNVTHRDPKKSSSLYAVVNVAQPPIRDNEWYTQHIIVRGKRIILKINDQVLVDYTEPENKSAFSKQFERRLGAGTFAFQAHDPQSKVMFRNIQVKRLP